MASEVGDNDVVDIRDENERPEDNEEEMDQRRAGEVDDIQDDVQAAEESPHNSQRPPRLKMKKTKFRNNYRNDRYNNAYGNYNGGYSPLGLGGGRNFMPPNNFGYPPPIFPPEQGPPGYMWGRGFGPEGPPTRRQPMDDRTIRYLMRCGVAKEHLKGLPCDLLLLMEPEYCGLCAHSLESFATSRMHYISKNHLKNQKKWLNQQSELGFRKGSEVAMKARELYCELCDVHITSKTHSESHYAGKPHRSIVEGRKNPRNPFLLQPGMEVRVAQLIRREKRHIKTTDEDGVEVVSMGPKSIPPELYCEICKTSVTCSEQMTMHLNGKRHLNKEKQHILKMMKGEGEESTSETQGKDNEEMDAEEGNEDLDEEDDKKDEGDYDWGNGSEAWDEIKHDDKY